MATLLYFGSFNPIHNAHLTMATEAQKAGGFERVLFIPAMAPANRFSSMDLWPYETRVSLLALALASVHNPTLAVSRIEQWLYQQRLPEEAALPLYTANVLEALFHASLVDLAPHSIDVLMGADTFASLPSWHRWEQLARVCTFWVVERPDQQVAVSVLPWVLEYRVVMRLVPMVAMVVSATDIRSAMRVDDWRFVAGRVPGVVLDALRRLDLTVLV